MPLVRVVGLGPGDRGHLTLHTAELIAQSRVRRLRTAVHPAAEGLDIESYDAWYDRADSFETLYADIVDDLVRLAHEADGGEVLYIVPGSPVVAEHTVELLQSRSDIRVICEPAVSVIDVACAALGVDPMSSELRIVDALATTEPFRGPGPLLILQTYAPEVLASVADRLPAGTPVTVLHHVGLPDAVVREMTSDDLVRFSEADHLTSLWVPGLRTAGEATDDLISFMRRLRAECPWDEEQTHASLRKYLIEEAYEALDALRALADMIERGDEDAALVAHAEEELGDVLFQVVFHAELGDEEGRFSFATIADGVRDKLTMRHPHVFGDVTVTSAADVEANWEAIKNVEKGRTSVLDGLAWDLPSLALYQKVLRKAQKVGAANAVTDAGTVATLVEVVHAATAEGLELEDELRRATLALAQQIRELEASGGIAQ